MGVVYTKEEVFFGRVPRAEDHFRAAENTRDAASRIEGVVTVMIHGSVAAGTDTLRSDLDALEVIDDQGSIEKRAEISDNLRKIHDEVSEETNVKIEAAQWFVSDSDAALRERLDDALYIPALMPCFDNEHWVRGELPQRFRDWGNRTIKPDEALSSMVGYMVHKEDRFMSAPLEFDPNDPKCIKALQRGLELPNSFSRKYAQLVTLLKQFGVGVDDKPNEENLKFRKTLSRLDARNVAYTDKLIEILGNPNDHTGEEYDTYLAELYLEVRRLGMTASTGALRMLDKAITL